MSTKHLVDPEILPLLEAAPGLDMSLERIAQRREEFNQMVVLGDADSLHLRRRRVIG